MSFNPDLNKQAHEEIISKKLKKVYHPPLPFNNNNVSQPPSEKHLGLTFDNCLTFDEHLADVSNKISKTICRIFMEITEYLTKASTSYSI